MTGNGHLQKFLPKILHSQPLRKSCVGLKPWPTEVRTEGLKTAMLVRCRQAAHPQYDFAGEAVGTVRIGLGNRDLELLIWGLWPSLDKNVLGSPLVTEGAPAVARGRPVDQRIHLFGRPFEDTSSISTGPSGASLVGDPKIEGLRATDHFLTTAMSWTGRRRAETRSGQLEKLRALGNVEAMARYFFNVVEDGHKVDSIGADFTDPQIARMEAVQFAAQMLKDEPERVWKGTEIRIEATDTWGTTLFTLLISGVDAEALSRHK
jgi:hypothetical protein